MPLDEVARQVAGACGAQVLVVVAVVAVAVVLCPFLLIPTLALTGGQPAAKLNNRSNQWLSR